MRPSTCARQSIYSSELHNVQVKNRGQIGSFRKSTHCRREPSPLTEQSLHLIGECEASFF